MNFEVFNRKTERKYLDAVLSKLTIDTGIGRMTFNRAACSELDISFHGNVEFLRFDKNWFVVKSEIDGYSLSKRSRDQGELVCHAAITIQNIVADLKQIETSRQYYLQKTEHEYQSFPVFELLLKPKKIK